MEKLFSEKANNRLWTIIFLCIVIPSIISSIIFYPREHYRILIFPFIYFILIYFIKKRIRKQEYYIVVIASLILCYAIINLPKVTSYPKQDMWGNYSFQPNKSAINQINNMNLKDDSIIFFSHEGYISYFFINKKNKCIHPITKPDTMTFVEYITICNINCIYFSQSFLYDRMYKNDSTLFDFLKRPNYYGFQAFSIHQSERKLFVKSELLNKDAEIY